MNTTMNVTLMNGNTVVTTMQVPEASKAAAIQNKVVESLVAASGWALEMNDTAIDWSGWPEVVAYVTGDDTVSIQEVRAEISTMHDEEESKSLVVLAKDLDTKKGSRALLEQMGIVVSDKAYKTVWRTNTMMGVARAAASAYEEAQDGKGAALAVYNEHYNKLVPGNNHVVGIDNSNVVVESEATDEGAEVVGAPVMEEPAPPQYEAKLTIVDGNIMLVNNKGRQLSVDLSELDAYVDGLLKTIELQKQATMVRTAKLRVAAADLKAYGFHFVDDKSGHIAPNGQTHTAGVSAVAGTVTQTVEEEVNSVVYDKKVVKTPKGTELYRHWIQDGVTHVEIPKKIRDLYVNKINNDPELSVLYRDVDDHGQPCQCVACGSDLKKKNAEYTKKLAPYSDQFRRGALCQDCQHRVLIAGAPRTDKTVPYTNRAKLSFPIA